MTATAPTPRARGRLLLRGQASAPPLFVPLFYAVAAQIESLAPRDFLAEPGKLARGLAALRDAAPCDALVTCCAGAIEAEAAGAELNWDSYPPRIAKPPARDVATADLAASPRLAAALEATRRLNATARGEPLLVAALTGPATLAAELAGAESAAETMIERAGSIGVDLAGKFCRAGASAIVLLEERAIASGDSQHGRWQAAVAPIVKVARFHQAIALIVVPAPAPRAVLGLETADRGGQPAIALPEVIGHWPSALPEASLITTIREVAHSTPVADLRAACARLQAPR